MAATVTDIESPYRVVPHCNRTSKTNIVFNKIPKIFDFCPPLPHFEASRSTAEKTHGSLWLTIVQAFTSIGCSVGEKSLTL